MNLQSVPRSALGLTQVLWSSAAHLSRRLLAIDPPLVRRTPQLRRPDPCVTREPRMRSGQIPWRLPVPPGVPDALPFAYRFPEPGTDDVIGPREP